MKRKYKPGLARLNIQPEMTYEQIAAEMNCSPQYIEQIEKERWLK